MYIHNTHTSTYKMYVVCKATTVDLISVTQRAAFVTENGTKRERLTCTSSPTALGLALLPSIP